MFQNLRIITIALCLCVTALVSACGTDNPLIGTWTYKSVSVDQAMIGGDYMQSMMENRMKGSAITFDGDGMTSTTAGGQSKTQAIAKYTVEGNDVTAWIEGPQGQKAGQKFIVSDDGQSMTMQLPTGVAKPTVVYARAAD